MVSACTVSESLSADNSIHAHMPLAIVCGMLVLSRALSCPVTVCQPSEYSPVQPCMQGRFSLRAVSLWSLFAINHFMEHVRQTDFQCIVKHVWPAVWSLLPKCQDFATPQLYFKMCLLLQSVHVRSESGLKERSIRQLSGGERRRVALALALGFADLISGQGQLRCNLIVLDEASASAHPVTSSLNYNDCCSQESVSMRILVGVLKKACTPQSHKQLAGAAMSC